VGSKRILWEKVNPDFEVLFRLMDGLHSDNGRRYWSSDLSIEVNTCDMRVDIGQMITVVEILLTMSHKTLACVEEDIQ
jgi:hypothetical protein